MAITFQCKIHYGNKSWILQCDYAEAGTYSGCYYAQYYTWKFFVYISPTLQGTHRGFTSPYEDGGSRSQLIGQNLDLFLGIFCPIGFWFHAWIVPDGTYRYFLHYHNFGPLKGCWVGFTQASLHFINTGFFPQLSAPEGEVVSCNKL